MRKQIRRMLIRHRLTRQALTRFDQSVSLVVILRSGLIDVEWYAAQRGRPAGRLWTCVHYVVRGRVRGLSPHPLFEPEWFSREKWRKFRVDPLVLYLRQRNWKKSPHPLFNAKAYLEATPAAGSHRHGPLGHFLEHAGPTTPLPGHPAVTWGEARERLVDRAREFGRQETLRRAERMSKSYDQRRERAFRRRWHDAPLPVADGDAPLVSVVLPVWNRASEVRAAIASVLAQTLDSWELLVVDDGSSDDTVAVVTALAGQDPRIKLLRQPHGGVCRARNLAMREARGRYLAWLDSDNTWYPDFLRAAVTAMAGQGLSVAYAVMEIRGATSGLAYRAFEGGIDHLSVANHIDLNVLVAERATVSQVGEFDESLRRTVDYDFVIRLARVAEIGYLPFVGARYVRDTADANRISVREPASWTEVVQNKHIVNWNDPPGGRIPGRVSVLIPTFQDWQMTRRCLAALLAAAGDQDLEIVVVDNGSRRAVGALIEAVAIQDRRVRLVRSPVNRNFGLGSNLAFGHSTGGSVVFLNNDTEVQPGWLPPLIRALDNPETLAAQPLLVYPDRTVQCAGVVFPTRGTFPVHFLAHHPPEDARRLGDIPVSAVTGAAMAMRAADVTELRGFDPIYANGWEDIDLCLRLRQMRPGTLVVPTGSEVVHLESKTPGRGANTGPNRRIFRDRWTDRIPRGDERLWEAAGFTVPHYIPDVSSDDGLPQVGRPLVTRRPERVPVGPATGLPSLRWAIKIAAPAGPAALRWGDLHFAHALGAALEQLCQTVVIDHRTTHVRRTSYLDDVVLVLRGLERVRPQPGRVNLLWVISHPDMVEPDEVAEFDAVFAAGAPWAARMSEEAGRAVELLLQCTEPERFRPDAARPDSGEDVLFVGNSRSVFRPIVRDAIAAGANLSVYGHGWEEFVDQRSIKGSYFPNDQLPAAYRAAGVLLNDHWEDMRREGFVSNRIFDAAASGARVVSDDVPGVEDMLDGLVRTYRTVDELRDLLTKPRDEVFPAEEERLRIASMVRRDHSFAARARTLLDAAADRWKG